MKANYNLHIITYFTYEDQDNPEEDFDGDYSFIEVKVGNKTIIFFGDYYHDKGCEKLDGFIEAWKMLTKKLLNINIEVTYEDKMTKDWAFNGKIEKL